MGFFKQHWWSEKKSNNLFIFCTALTNNLVNNHPLCDVDVDAFHSAQKKIYAGGQSQMMKKRNEQQRYREAWRRKLARFYNGSMHLSTFEGLDIPSNNFNGHPSGASRTSDGSAIASATSSYKNVIDVSRIAETQSNIVRNIVSSIASR